MTRGPAGAPLLAQDGTVRDRAGLITPTPYHRVRVLWSLQALRQMLRRWGAYVLVATALLGAGTSGGLANAAGAAAWLVLPLWHEVAQSAARGVLATLLQAAAGAAVVWALRPLLLPRAWLEAERALPLPRATQMRSDARLCLWALAPLLGLYALGALPVLAANPGWLRAHRSASMWALGLAAVGSLGLGVALLQWRRWPPRGRHGATAASATPALLRRRAWPSVLLYLPLLRGPARRCGGALAAGAAVACVPVLGLWWWPQGGPWWLAALGLAGLLASTRVGTLVREEVVPLLAQTTMLPLQPRRLRRSAACLPLLPWLPALALLAARLPALATSGPRPAVLAAFAALALTAALLEGHDPPPDAATYGARWLFMLVLLLALASSVWP